MSVFSGRGVMVVGADSFPLSVAGPRMQRGGMGRLELLLWSGQPMNAGMVQAQMTQYKGAGLTVVGWSVHNPGEDHRAALTSIRNTWPGTEIVGLNLNLEAGWFLEPGHAWDTSLPISLEHAGLLAAVKDIFGAEFPLAVTIIPAKVYPFAMWEGAVSDYFVELYDGACVALRECERPVPVDAGADRRGPHRQVESPPVRRLGAAPDLQARRRAAAVQLRSHRPGRRVHLD